MLLPYPRAYIDWAVPRDHHGHEIGICYDDATYRYYLEWLADYLYKTEIPVPESQKATLEELSKTGYATMRLSDCLGYPIWETEIIQEYSASGNPYEDWHQQELALYNKLPDDEKEIWGEEFFISKEDYHRLGEEYRESKKVPSHIQHADIPYRSILAALFKGMPDPKKRYEELDYFYKNFDECASK